jgi:FtsH-binding integral membrane protein
MHWPALSLASVALDAREFFMNLFTGALRGDFLSLVVVASVALVVLRFTVAKWLFTLIKQIVIFGGLAFAVWFGAHAIEARWGPAAGQAVLYVGGTVVLGLFFIMLYMFFLRRAREKEMLARGVDPRVAKRTTPNRTAMRVGAGPLAGQGVPVHYEKASVMPVAAGAGSGQGMAAGVGYATAAPRPVDHDASRLEETLKKLNILGAAKEQNLVTVAVLILVAQFGVFTSRTISAPNHSVGLVLFSIFIALSVVFVKTAYKNYLKGITHFTFAIIFAFVLSALILVYWQQRFACGDFPQAELIDAACMGAAATDEVPITWATVVDPRFYFASDGLIAAITGVAFSTLLTKGGS